MKELSGVGVVYTDWGTGHIRVTSVQLLQLYTEGLGFLQGVIMPENNFLNHISKTVLPSLSSISLTIHIFLSAWS